MKTKIWLSIILFSFLYCLFSVTFAQSIWDISSSFCNSWIITSGLNFSTDSAKYNEICTQFTNNSDQDISIKIWFPDWTITNDEFKKPACRWEWNIENFGKYVIQKNKTLIIPAKQTINEKDYIRFPAWFDGIVRGCMTYFLNQTKTDVNNQLNIVVRQTSYISILVWSNFKRSISIQQFDKTDNWWTNKKISTELNFDWDMILKLNFTNSWDVDELFIWSWRIYNKLWFSKYFEIPTTKLLTNTSKEISVNMWKLPFYWWFFKIELNWNIEPEILFNRDSLTPKLKEIISIQEETIINIIPRNIIIAVIVLLFAFSIIRYFIKRKKNKQ